jgi:choline dehydrogenase-like flavoprotein
MNMADVVIVGSGPAGVSAAWPLIEAGKRVVILEAAAAASHHDLPLLPHDEWRVTDPEQYRYFEKKSIPYDLSPKFSLARHARALRQGDALYAYAKEQFSGGAYLAAGGMSNAWGGGIAAFDAQDINGWPIAYSDLKKGYRAIADRIGISGHNQDGLKDFFGSFYSLLPPLEMDNLARTLLSAEAITGDNFLLGQSRQAVLTRPLHERSSCDYLGNCFYGCARKSIYNANDEIPRLSQHSNFTFVPDYPVERLIEHKDYYELVSPVAAPVITARRVILAAGTIGSTIIMHRSLSQAKKAYPLACNPAAAFALLVARGRPKTSQRLFALSQLSYTLPLGEGASYAFGNIFTTHGLPANQLLQQVALTLPSKRLLAHYLFPRMLVANCFLHSRYSAHRLIIDHNQVTLSGQFRQDFENTFKTVRKKLSRVFIKRGAVLLPGSFRLAPAGADFHYTGTIAHRSNPAIGESFPNGQIHGFRQVYIADGAALPPIPAKPHTFTLMANAHRIASLLAAAA